MSLPLHHSRAPSATWSQSQFLCPHLLEKKEVNKQKRMPKQCLHLPFALHCWMSFETLDSSIGYRKYYDKGEHKKDRIDGLLLRVVSELVLWFGKVEFELSLLNHSRLARHDRVDVIMANYKKKFGGQDRTMYSTLHGHGTASLISTLVTLVWMPERSIRLNVISYPLLL